MRSATQYGSFVFIGTPVYNEEKWYKNETSASGYKYARLQFGIKVSDVNMPYVEIMGGFSTVKENIIKAMDKDKNNLEIAFKDRHDTNIINSVMDFKKLKVNFTSSDEKDSSIFLAEYDFAEAIKNGLPKDKRVVVIGKFEINRYKDKEGKYVVNNKYTPTKIRLAKDDEVNKAELTLGFVFDKDTLDKSRFEKEGKMDVSAYMTTYDKVLRGNIFVPVNFVIDLDFIMARSGIAMTDSLKTGARNLIEGYFTVVGDKVMETQWKAEVLRGATVEDVTEDDLSEDEKLQIQFGMATFEEIKKQRPKKYGDKVDEIKLLRPTNKFEDEDKKRRPNNDTDYTQDDFIIPEVGTESKDAVFNGGGTSQPASDADTLKSLFG